MIDALISAWQATSTLELVSVVFGLAYIVLAARENIWCWPCAFIGTSTAIVLFWDASLIMESGLNVYYLMMAGFGWWQWQYGSKEKSTLKISRWSLTQHAITLGLIAALTFLSGSLLNDHTSAALPFVDSLTTWSAVITTWMVARKILENWLYWIVIDAISIWVYLERGLYLYALLFVLYTIIAVFGYIHWRQRFKHV